MTTDVTNALLDCMPLDRRIDSHMVSEHARLETGSKTPTTRKRAAKCSFHSSSEFDRSRTGRCISYLAIDERSRRVDDLQIRHGADKPRPTSLKARCVGSTCQKPGPKEPCRWLTLAAALFIGIAGNTATFASSVTSSSRSERDEHAQHCGCGSKCRQASCCCRPRKTRVQPRTPPPAEAPQHAGSNPCVKSAPCSDTGLPGSPSVSPYGKAPALSMIGHIPIEASESFVPSRSRCIPPARRASRLDEPPEVTAIG
jgi:hypothetical protein